MAAYLTAADLAHIYHVRPALIHTWAHRDGWRRTRGRPRRYHAGDAQASYDRRQREVSMGPAARCPHCLDDGHVCEDHPDFPWEGLHGTVEGHRQHGAAGMPCPACCPPVPEDGTRSITEAFTPGWRAPGITDLVDTGKQSAQD